MDEARTHRCLLISDFNLDNFAGYLDNDEDGSRVETIVAPYGQVVPTLAQEGGEDWEREPDCCMVWTRPEGVVESFNRLLMGEKVDGMEIEGEVDEFSSLLLGVSERVKAVFVPTWWVPTCNRGYGMLDMRRDTGIAYHLMRMNLRLADNLADARNVFLLNIQKWIESAGKNAFNPKLWQMGKIAFHNKVFLEAVKDLKAALDGLDGRARKLIIVDLDDTLWGGIVGDEGWEKLKIGGHDHIGEAFVEFQRALKALTRRGILLGIASKNEEGTALEAIEKHPEMVLVLDDFAGWRIDWEDKAQNLVDLVAELNLGLQSVVFIDDSPLERARVREALPEVLVPDWPADPAHYTASLLSLRCFDVPHLSGEDADRSGMYAAERKRRELKKSIPSLDDWLHSLDLKVEIEELNEANLPRAVQLFNRTNQMNLTTRRLTEAELKEWADHPERELWVFHVADKFGDAGLTGLLSLEKQGEEGRIVDFVLSCRVMGRRVEETMIHYAVQQARIRGLTRICAEYVPTSKNKPCLDLFARVLAVAEGGADRFFWEVERDFPLPAHVEIVR